MKNGLRPKPFLLLYIATEYLVYSLLDKRKLFQVIHL